MFKTGRTRLQRLRVSLVRLCTLSNIGITPRLAIAFASVAILAAAYNFIVENGVSVVEYVTRSESRAEVLQQPAPAVQAPEPSRIMASQVSLAWRNFDKSVREHADSRTSASGELYSAARTELRGSTEAYAAQLERTTGEKPQAMLDALQVHEQNAEVLIRSAQDRRALLANYSTIFARMSERLQASIDGAWKIMGRVVARQSLLKLSSQLDDIQARFAMRDGPGTASQAAARLAAAEQIFATTLTGNETALRRSQGAKWFVGMSEDLKLLERSRKSLAQAEGRRAKTSVAFSQDSERVLAMLAKTPAGTVELHAPSRVAVPAVEAIAPEPRQEVRALPPVSSGNRALVAWISVVVLAVLAYICIATILSVVRPVRRLMAATVKLANGGVAFNIAPGGIRELDTLGQAFNAMAAELAAAQAANRDVLQTLETKVDERTRQLQELAERDPLTGLANRRQLFTALNSSIVQATESMTRVGAFFLDIDNFKTLNDSMGHAYGDRVLVTIARRLEMTARSFGFAARLGGDEFMLVHEGAATVEEIVASGHRIVQAFQEPIHVDGRELIVSVSVGASIYPDHEQSAQALMRAADAALFNAKALGRSQLTMFTPELLVKASAKFAIEQRLRRAIEKGEFELFYQPEICVKTFEVCMVEALLRWRMPDGSYRFPAEFLEVAEESGLIMEINEWVLRAAIQSASKWHHGAWPEARVAINVSPRQFLDYKFVEKLQGLLAEFKLPTRCVELELTESVLQTGPVTIAALGELRAIGVAIALDDFGTGYSSMASLEQLPLTRIKLDRSLIARMDNNAHSASIARATIRLCGELGLKVTAEGVERLEQFTALLGYESMSLQGYLLARPVPADGLLPLLERMPAHCQELLLMSRNEPGPSTAVPDATARSEEARSASPTG